MTCVICGKPVSYLRCDPHPHTDEEIRLFAKKCKSREKLKERILDILYEEKWMFASGVYDEAAERILQEIERI
jgi:hypothetical protein